MLKISKEIILYSLIVNDFFCLILLSMFRGWLIIQIKFRTNSKNQIYSYQYIFNIILGFIKNFKKMLKIRGMGFKVSVVKTKLIIKIGLSHRIIYILENNLKIKYNNKQFIIIYSRCLSSIKNFYFLFQKFNSKNKYKKKGNFFKGIIYFLKFNSKKTKF